MGVLIGLFAYWEYHDFQRRTSTMRRDHVESQMALVRGEVEKAVDYILYEKSRTEQRLREVIQSRVHEAHAVATHIYREHSGDYAENDIRKMIKDALRPVRFNSGRGYYFATNLDGKEELFAARPGEEGKDYLDVRDSRGKYLVREMIEVVKGAGEGFVEYTWTKPGSEGRDFPKIAFVKLFEPLNYFIGTGEYLDDMTADIQAEVLERIGTIRYADSGYIFIVSYDGLVLSGHPKQKNVGKNLWEMEDPDGVKVIQEERRAVENRSGDFIRYRWPRPGESEASPKISFIKGIADWEWMVGTGVYVDEMEPVIAGMARQLRSNILQKVSLVAMVFAGLALTMFLLASRSARFTKEGFKAFSSFFEKAAADSVPVDEDRLYFSEFQTLAASANRMLDERRQFEEKLTSELEMRGKILADLKESEEKYQKLFNNEVDAISIFDMETKRFLDANEAFLRLYGYTREEVLQLTVYDVSAEPEQSKAAIDKSATAGDTLIPLRHHKKKDGTEFWVELSAGPFTWKGRKVMYAVVRDITERIELDSERLKSQKLESVGVLAGGIAHDFNNLLMGIYGNISLAKMSSDSGGEIYKYLADTEKSFKRAKDLTQQLLTFAKGGVLAKKTISLVPVIMESVRFALSGSNVKSEISLADNIRPVEADEGQISQVLQNIVINADQAMPEGGTVKVSVGNVTVGAGQASPLPEGDYVAITIEDAGIGIPEEYIAKIFDPFYTTKTKGSGLGLATAYSIIKKHDGAIQVESTVGKGTTFNIYIPASEKILPARDSQRAGVLTGEGRVLIMDDEEVVATVCRNMLLSLKYEADVARHGEEALEKFRQALQSGHPYDCVILDLTIPGGMGGKETIERLLKIDPEVKAVVSSGYASDILLDDFRRYGFAASMSKPYTIEEMSRIIHRLIAS